jgi:hypothetical protein
MTGESIPDCPLLNEPCRGERCAWFVEKFDACAVPTMAEDLIDLQGKVDLIENNLDTLIVLVTNLGD